MRAVSAEVVSWSADRFGFRVECSPALLAAIDDDVRRGFALAPDGGVERGGVLFGDVAADLVTILAYRPVASEEPSFSFSGETEAGLLAAAELSAADLHLRGLVPVGWYRSCNRTEIRLTAADLDGYRRCFPEPWQVALVLRPERNGPTRAAFFFPQPGGAAGAAQPHPEFAIPTAFDESPGPAPRARWWLWPAAALLLLLPFAVFFERGTAPRPGGIGLRLHDSAGQMRVSWDRQAGPVLRASAAMLEIREGQRITAVDLDAADLVQGSVYYWRSSGPTRVRMVLLGPAGEVEESVELPGAAAPPPPVNPPAASVVVDVGPGVPLPPREPAAPQPPPARQPRAFRYAAPAPPPAPPQVIAAPPVRLPAAGRSAPAPMAASLPQPPPPPPAARPPASGQIIWTGRLPRRGVVHLEGARASQGYLSAPLPGARASVAVLPGEMTPEGLRLYTADVRLGGRREPPGPQNGWNPTEYVWDPARTREITVLEAPLPQNGWKRMVLRSESRGYSVVVLRWEAAVER